SDPLPPLRFGSAETKPCPSMLDWPDRMNTRTGLGDWAFAGVMKKAFASRAMLRSEIIGLMVVLLITQPRQRLRWPGYEKLLVLRDIHPIPIRTRRVVAEFFGSLHQRGDGAIMRMLLVGLGEDLNRGVPFLLDVKLKCLVVFGGAIDEARVLFAFAHQL